MKKDSCFVISNQTDKAKLFGEAGPEKEGKRVTFSKILCVFSDVLLAYCLALATYSIVKYFDIVQSSALLSVGEYGGYSTAPDLGFLAFLLPAAFVFAGLTHTFYYNKERFANCIKIRFEYIKQLLMFKLNSGLYQKDELVMQLDNTIAQAEMEADALVSSDIATTEQEQENIMV